MREGTIPPNWTNIVQLISQSGALENIYLKDTWFTLDLDKYPSKLPSHEPITDPDNNNNTLTSFRSVPHVQENTAIKGVTVSEVTERPYSKVVQNTSNLNRFCFEQQAYISTNGMTSCEV